MGCKVDQCANVLDARQPEFDPQDLHGGWREVMLANCSIVLTYESLCACTQRGVSAMV